MLLSVKIALFPQTDVRIISNDDMIEYLYVEKFSAFYDTPCHHDIFSARRRVSARVIMYKNDRRCRMIDSFFEQLSRMDERFAERTDGDKR